MKKVFKIKAIVVAAVMLLMATASFAQMGKTQASPRDSVSGKIHGATISINYGSPSVKGRKIYGDGGLQPFGKMWRAGANQATTLTTDKDIMVEGKPLKAGKYTLFVTPGAKEYTITINSQTGQWGIKNNGEANEKPENDVVVAMVKPKKAEMTERLKYVITKKGFELVWENTAIPVAIK